LRERGREKEIVPKKEFDAHIFSFSIGFRMKNLMCKSFHLCFRTTSANSATKHNYLIDHTHFQSQYSIIEGHVIPAGTPMCIQALGVGLKNHVKTLLYYTCGYFVQWEIFLQLAIKITDSCFVTFIFTLMGLPI
ncbi:MAG: hypothetical protein MJE68_02585, partial [Proteobacteria bacterium]|nr:hypothetical protein [Pseudomonadota bacterium]